MFNFTIPGEPKGKGRPQFSTKGGYARAITPEATANYENLVKLSFLQAHGKAEPYAKDVPLVAKITAFFPIPQSASKKKQAAMEAGEIVPTKKPDTDNIAKIVLDALNGLAYYDDAQIVVLSLQKAYSTKPRVDVQIFEW